MALLFSKMTITKLTVPQFQGTGTKTDHKSAVTNIIIPYYMTDLLKLQKISAIPLLAIKNTLTLGRLVPFHLLPL